MYRKLCDNSFKIKSVILFRCSLYIIYSKIYKHKNCLTGVFFFFKYHVILNYNSIGNTARWQILWFIKQKLLSNLADTLSLVFHEFMYFSYKFLQNFHNLATSCSGNFWYFKIFLFVIMWYWYKEELSKKCFCSLVWGLLTFKISYWSRGP